ncbi:MAG: multicopper oxidase domain-containing protein [Syntrophobacterales bacterium]|jgi:hypothetical protein|nr:multicopper oxidase domain-containing protein [Syntrophobacterales bacterium]
MKRRDFIKCGTCGLAALVLGNVPGILGNSANAAAPPRKGGANAGVINLTVTDAIKEMVTHNTGQLPNGAVVGPGNPARCYFWIFKDQNLPADCPGPVIFTTKGYRLTVNVTNELDEPHAFSIPRLGVTTGPIAPGATGSVTFTASKAGTFLYYDDLNAPVNRVMGLHGAFIVMPYQAVTGHKFTPFDNPPPNIQQLFDDLGTASWWPGLAWEEGDPTTDTPPFRQNIWVMHQASPKLFDAVGNNAVINFTTTSGEPVSGPARDPVVFTKAFLHDSFNPTHDPFNLTSQNYVAQYFTISGQSGHFAHNNPWLCPYSRVGEPYLIRLLNAGLWLHSTHIHANHVFVLSHNNAFDVFPGANDNPIWVDVYTANPLDTYEWLIPYMRPPDVPSDLGIGRDDLQQSLDVSATAVSLGGFGLGPGGPPYTKGDVPASAAQTTWPPLQELQMFIPNVQQVFGKDKDGNLVDCAVRLSPVCFPMHDHSEATQVAQGGNYNCGLICGILFTGDRKGGRPGQTSKVITFPDRPESGDPMMPVAHGPVIMPRTAGCQVTAPPFVMPTLP